jgi:hypothetical protein
MTTSDKRRSERIPINAQLAPGEMFLTSGHERVPVSGIKDLSDTGISIYLNGAVAEGDGVTIEYADRGIQFEVFGTVRWCRDSVIDATAPAWQGPKLIGVELLASSILSSAILKNHVRRER